jgi:hypothetical protein
MSNGPEGGGRFANAVAKRIVWHMNDLVRQRDAATERVRQLEAMLDAEGYFLDALEPCSYCNVLFDPGEDYDWACVYNLDSQHHKIWCHREACDAEGDMVQCASCDYGVCQDCLVHCNVCQITPHCPSCPCDNE